MSNYLAYFAYWDDRHVFRNVSTEGIVENLLAHGYPRNLQLQVNNEDLTCLAPSERKLKTPPGYAVQSIDLPAYVLRHSIQVRESGIFGIGAKVVKKNIILGASTRQDLHQLASACGIEVQVTTQEIHSMAINLTKSNALDIFRTIKLYERLLQLTAFSIPPLDLTATEISVFYRWARETHTKIDQSDLPTVFDYVEDLVAQAERYQVDDIPLSRLFDVLRKRKGMSIGSEEVIRSTWGRIQQNQHDGQTYYELALHLMKRLSLDLESLLNFKTEETMFHVIFEDGYDEILDVLSKALALGVHDPVHNAVVRFSYAFMLGSVIQADQVHTLEPKNLSQAHSLYREAIAILENYLRHNPRDLVALQVLSACYKMLNQTSKQEEISLEVEKVMQLAELGVLGHPIAPAKQKAPTTQQKGLHFEEVCLRLVREMGFDAQITEITGDGGIDIVAMSTKPIFAGKYVIQCKAWKQSIGEPVVRDLYGVVHSERANKGILITTSTYTKSALAFARDKPLELIDGPQLRRLLEQYVPDVLQRVQSDSGTI